MTDESPVAHLAGMQVETNFTPDAAVEKPVAETIIETSVAEPVAPEAPVVETAPVEISPEAKPDPANIESQAPVLPDEKENATARELIETRMRAERAEAEIKKLQPAAKPLGDRPVQPVIENFDTYENFLTALKNHDKAVDEWNDRRVEAAIDQKVAERIADTERTRKAEAESIAIQTKIVASQARHPDFNIVTNPIAPAVNNIPALKDFVIQNPMGTEVVYMLGKNPALLEQLSRQNTVDMYETLINMANQLKKPVAVKPTNAPEPIKPVGTNEVAKTKLSNLAMGDYFALRQQQEIKARHLN